jgi:hypothetical protein
MTVVLSSSFLLSPEPVVTLYETYTVINAVNNFINNNNFFNTPPLMLFPSLNLVRIQMEYENIFDQHNTVNLVLARSQYKIYFCNINNMVYQIITDDFTQRVYQIVQVINPNF